MMFDNLIIVTVCNRTVVLSSQLSLTYIRAVSWRTCYHHGNAYLGQQDRRIAMYWTLTGRAGPGRAGPRGMTGRRV